MKFTGGPNSRRGLFAAALTLFAFAAIAPSEAQATCGDYVMLGTHSHAAVKQNSPGAGRIDEVPEIPGRRCRGATCSNGDHPSLPVVPRIAVNADQWACHPARLPLIETGNPSLLVAETPLRASYRGLSIFRPPRSR
jgi:hypothetical protein